MALPQRKYYTLDKAAKKIGGDVDVADLIHFAAVGIIELSVKYEELLTEEYMESLPFRDEFIEIVREPEINSKLDESIEFKNDYLHIIEFLSGDHYSISYMNGLLGIPSSVIDWHELNLVNEPEYKFSSDIFNYPRSREGFTYTYSKDPLWIIPRRGVSLKREHLLMTDYEIENLLNGGLQTEKKESNKRLIKSMENRELIRKAIIKLLVNYPHDPADSVNNYRGRNGKLIINRIAKALDYHEATLFSGENLPIKDPTTLNPIISNFLKNNEIKNRLKSKP
ncbi:hypothetical protein [Providencia hangzhouensis]